MIVMKDDVRDISYEIFLTGRKDVMVEHAEDTYAHFICARCMAKVKLAHNDSALSIKQIVLTIHPCNQEENGMVQLEFDF